MVTVYGIKNCDTVKKALTWLAANGIEAKLHDYRVDGIDAAYLAEVEALFGWQELVNKRSTTWRNLDQATKDGLNQQTALALLLAQPTLIKRPIVLGAAKALIGFNDKQYTNVFNG
ncbi:ArsC family reductase [Testudinibacter sp. TR-2022]|uniref:ArsC family reductase n=1 Tax=Testudinibacter sp. TR-2022 TaxID=2585029 RepID=UPI0011180881|nr:ArsC family reductase [Testudinibacter sp. TR-2022]TNH03556.1 ArsC family reductase [Pasteurellaceae bacterium Phil31]TNH07352.1 ArsC family reductase [Testudinibacter sp. TR-2022]TNH12831.1 ArsC family reductase [Testudinibacter sp. TR-2022]TNH13335.1 ArsC family reductase [Testudinibacter sp. TR-2022]TNH16348.1 ArsC family reductase [Testudinibacter sp. TR-2022]